MSNGEVGDADDVMGVDRIGASTPGGGVMREYGFGIENVYARAKALLDHRRVVTPRPGRPAR